MPFWPTPRSGPSKSDLTERVWIWFASGAESGPDRAPPEMQRTDNVFALGVELPTVSHARMFASLPIGSRTNASKLALVVRPVLAVWQFLPCFVREFCE